MWDFSWIERPEYARLDVVLDELLERGYDAVRIDPFPHAWLDDGVDELVASPIWTQFLWGSATPILLTGIRDRLIEFMRLASERGIAVLLSSWHRTDLDHRRDRLSDPLAAAGAWRRIIRTIERAGYGGSIWGVDICNEWAHPQWAAPAYLHTGLPLEVPTTRSHPGLMQWYRTVVTEIRRHHSVPLIGSFSDELDPLVGLPDAQLDYYDVHLWVSSLDDNRFYSEIDYDLVGCPNDPRAWRALEGRAERHYRRSPRAWLASLESAIDHAAARAAEDGVQLLTTEGWAIVGWKDGPGLDWGWIREIADAAVDAALRHPQWVALCSSNFCGPQYPGMWSDVEWHRRITDRITSGAN